MSFWGKVFGSEKALAGIVDGVTNGLDALIYTDEEKAAVMLILAFYFAAPHMGDIANAVIGKFTGSVNKG